MVMNAQNADEEKKKRKYWADHRKNIVLIALFVALSVLAATAVLDRPLRGIDERASSYLNRTMLKAGMTFAVARGLNGIVSVIQESRIGFDFIVSGDLALFELLDPVNDLIEKFSTIMIVSTVSLGIQKILLEIGRWVGVRILFTFSFLLLLAGVVLPDRFGDARRRVTAFAGRMLVVAVVIRVVIPVVSLVSSGIDVLFLDEKYRSAKSFLENTYEEGKETSGVLDYMGLKLEVEDSVLQEEKTERRREEDAGILSRLFRLQGRQEEMRGYDASIPVNIKSLFSKLVARLREITSHVIDLMVIFLIQTIVIPLLTLWGLIRVVKFLFNKTFTSSRPRDKFFLKKII